MRRREISDEGEAVSSVDARGGAVEQEVVVRFWPEKKKGDGHWKLSIASLSHFFFFLNNSSLSHLIFCLS